MGLSIWETFVALFQGNDQPDDAPSGEDNERRFVPSPLDLSVRVGHGGGDDDQVRELSRLDARAREMDATQRDR